MNQSVPPYFDLIWPALKAARELGGSASNQELDTTVIAREGYPEAVQQIPHKDGPTTELQYRLAWARTILKNMGLLTRSGRGIWSVTERGQTITQPEMRPLYDVIEDPNLDTWCRDSAETLKQSNQSCFVRNWCRSKQPFELFVRGLGTSPSRSITAQRIRKSIRPQARRRLLPRI